MKTQMTLIIFLMLTTHMSFAQDWTIYNKDNSGLPDNDISAIAVDFNDVAWIGVSPFNDNDGGLVKFDGENWIVYNVENSDLPSDNVRVIFVDDEGDKWIGTSQGLVHIQGQDEQWIIYNSDNSDIQSSNIFGIDIDSNGDLWFTNSGVSKFDGENWTNYNPSNSDIPTVMTWEIVIDNEDNKWIATLEDGLIKFDGENWEHFTAENSELEGDKIRCIATDQESEVWMGVHSHLMPTIAYGMARFDSENWMSYDMYNSGMPSQYISVLTVNEDNHLWIGASSAGIVKFDEENWVVYNTSNSEIPDDRIKAIFIHENGGKWIGTHDGLAVFSCEVLADFSFTSDGESVFFENNSSEGSFLWDFGDGNTSNLHTPQHTYEQNGIYEVCLTVIMDCGQRTMCYEVEITSVGVEKHGNESYSIYPNPAQDGFFVEFTAPNSKEITYSVYNMLGQEVVSNSMQQSKQLYISSENWRNGLYVITFKDEDGREIEKKKVMIHK